MILLSSVDIAIDFEESDSPYREHAAQNIDGGLPRCKFETIQPQPQSPRLTERDEPPESWDTAGLSNVLSDGLEYR